MNKKKVIRITTVPESMLSLLKGQLNFISNNGFEVIGISSNSNFLKMVEEQEGIKIIPVNMSRKISPINDLISLIKIILILMREKPFIVHTHTPKAGIIGMMASWITRVPHRLHTVAGMPLLVATGNKKKLLVLIEKITYFFSTIVYPNSKGLYNYIVKYNYTELRKLRFIGNGSSNGIDTNYFNPEFFSDTMKNNFRSNLKIRENDFIYLFVGRLVRDKGVNEIISAFDKISKFKTNIKLILVGVFEDHLDPLNSLTMDMINNNVNIILTGHQNDVRPFYSISDVFLFPSYREGFPNVVLQSCAMGIPVIATDINGCNEIIQNQINGFLIKPQDTDILYEKMLLLMDNDLLRLTFSKNCRPQIQKKFERNVIWKEILKEYNRL